MHSDSSNRSLPVVPQSNMNINKDKNPYSHHPHVKAQGSTTLVDELLSLNEKLTLAVTERTVEIDVLRER
jgi:hypothetical protein